MASGISAGTAFVDIQPNIGAGFQGALASKLGPIGAAAGIALGAGLAAGIGGAVVLKNIGETFDEAFDTIRVGTGATGAELEGLQTDFKAVFANVPTDAATAGAAIADLNTRLDLTGGNLQATATQFLNLSRITGTDVSRNIEAVTRVFGDWGITIDDQGERLDQLFRASQQTGIGVDVLAERMTKFGAPLRQLGFGFDTTAALLGKFEKEGVNSELVMGSLRIALGKFARAGEPAEETLARVTAEIKAAGSASEANAIALEVFGARAGPDMAAAIREGRFELGELFDTVAHGTDTVNAAAGETEDFAEKWNRFKNRVLVALEPAATKFLGLLGSLVDTIGPKLEPLIETIGNVISAVVGVFTGGGDAIGGFESKVAGIASGIGPVIGAIGEIFKTAFGIVRDVIAEVVEFFRDNADTIGSIASTIGEIIGTIAEVVRVVFEGIAAFWAEWGDEITALLGNAFRTIAGIIDGAFKIIKGIFDVVLGILTGDWSRAWEGIKGILGGVWKVITSIISGAVGQVQAVFGDALRNLGNLAKTGIDNVVEFFRQLPGRIFDFLRGLPGQLLQLGKDLVLGLVNGLANLPKLLGDKLKSGISSAINAVKSFFGFGSPSRVMAEVVGRPLGEGVAVGILGTSGATAEAFEAIIAGGADQARAAARFELERGNRPQTSTVAGLAASDTAATAALTEAGGMTITIEEGGVQVFNPEPEPASVTVPRELRALERTFRKG